ncbi:hypothetical protein BP6252_06533 [Coleophoma cylindrospora]|uniref:Heterokaryon incompatibility domain-containing protein n=1 Tax=Coleophoma cylindrospora TaxID=1849047 RepID=A0A3D8RNK4_9HELO|nr:hypothetical protein BP6252_06533 [Coleophoma cylindrospora]
MSCLVCANLLPTELEDPAMLPGQQRVTRFILLSDLRDSATNTSCSSCQLLLAALNLYKEDYEESDNSYSLELRLGIGRPLQLFWRRNDAIYIEIFTRDVNEGSVPATIGKTLEVSQNSSSDSCIKHASSWIHNCRTSHKTCQALSPTPLPTRVIDVSGRERQEPFLVESSGRYGDYIALSYCWGDDKSAVLKTLPSNYNDHCREIPSSPDAMPKTVRDAIDICRRLRFHYIWIDALCIVQGREPFQGDVSDFERESPRMASVYANATLTLGADGASGNREGIYREQTYGEAPHQLPYGPSGALVYVRKQLARLHDDNALLMRMPMSPMSLTEPINMRAWTLPEAILSNRMLHYTSEELVWECNEVRSCECGRQVPVGGGGPNSSNRVVRNEGFARSLTKEQLYRHWHDIVQLFSERQLGQNRDSDKLVALSRLANQFSTRLRLYESEDAIEYLAGLWKGDIVRSLLWVVEDDFYRRLRDKKMEWRRPDPKKYRAPSWSWVSIEAPVLYHPINKFLPTAEVIDVSIERKDEIERFGEVINGKLVIKGLLRHGLEIKQKQAHEGNLYAGFTNGTMWNICDAQGSCYAFICDDTATVTNENSEYSTLYIGHTDYSGEEVPYYHAFLVLQKKESGTYNRVGISSRSAWDTQAELSKFLRMGTEEEITIE